MSLKDLIRTFREDPVTRLGMFGLSLWMFIIGLWISFPFESFIPTATSVSSLTDSIPEELVAIIFMSLGFTGVVAVLRSADRLMEWASVLIASWSIFIVAFYILSFWQSINVITFSCTATLSAFLFISMIRNRGKVAFRKRR